jgi:hypothetical protein
VKRVKLSGGMVALVDDEDAVFAEQHHWHAHRVRDTWYAFRTEHVAGSGRPGQRRSHYLHRALLGNPPCRIEFINGDTLDSRRANLRLFSDRPSRVKPKREASPRKPASLKERFDHLYKVDESTGCWVWMATIANTGYGRIGERVTVDKWKTEYAHRVSWTLYRGPIPDGLTLDHLCRNRRCVNPDHLEPVSLAENIRRGNSPGALAARLGVCARGHCLTEDNSYYTPDGRRQCRACIKLRNSWRPPRRRAL